MGLNDYFGPMDVVPIREDTLSLLDSLKEQMPKTALDIGCGSGYLAVQLAKLGCNVTATDMDEKSIEVSKENARTAGVQVDFRLTNLFKGIDGTFDAVIFNPPLVFSGNKPYKFARGFVAKIPPINAALEWFFSVVPNTRRDYLLDRYLTLAKDYLNEYGFCYLVLLDNEISGVSAYVKEDMFAVVPGGKRTRIVIIPRDALKGNPNAKKKKMTKQETLDKLGIRLT